MIIRVSAKFHRQYSCVPEAQDLPVLPCPETWNLDVLSNGPKQLLVLASEEYSLFSVLIPMTRTRNFELFEKAFRQRLVQLFENVHWDEHPALTPLRICRRTDRRVIGSQNDFLLQTFSHLQRVEQPASPEALLRIEERVNQSPMSYLDMDSPVNVFLKRRPSW